MNQPEIKSKSERSQRDPHPSRTCLWLHNPLQNPRQDPRQHGQTTKKQENKRILLNSFGRGPFQDLHEKERKRWIWFNRWGCWIGLVWRVHAKSRQKEEKPLVWGFYSFYESWPDSSPFCFPWLSLSTERFRFLTSPTGVLFLCSVQRQNLHLPCSSSMNLSTLISSTASKKENTICLDIYSTRLVALLLHFKEISSISLIHGKREMCINNKSKGKSISYSISYS